MLDAGALVVDPYAPTVVARTTPATSAESEASVRIAGDRRIKGSFHTAGWRSCA